MLRSVPYDASGARLNWGCAVTPSDYTKIRPERAIGAAFTLPITGDRSMYRLALHDGGDGFPVVAATSGDMHFATMPAIDVGALESWDRLWLPVDHDPTNTDGKITEATIRLNDGIRDWYWDGADWSLATANTHWSTVAAAEANISRWTATTLQVKIRLRSTHSTVSPVSFGFRVSYSIHFAAKLQTTGTRHAIPTSWLHAALWRDIMPEIAGLDFRWWGQKSLANGSANLGFSTDGFSDLSLNADEVLAVYYAGTDGETLGDQIPGSWAAGEYTFSGPSSGPAEVIFEVSVKPAIALRPSMDLVNASLPLITPIAPSKGMVEPPEVISIPDVSNLLIKRWKRDRYPLTFDLRIDAHDDGLAEHLAETITEWLDHSGGRVVTSTATGHQYGVRLSAPSRPGSSFAMPSRVLSISVFAIPHFQQLADVHMVAPASSFTVNVTGDVAVA